MSLRITVFELKKIITKENTNRKYRAPKTQLISANIYELRKYKFSPAPGLSQKSNY